MIKRKALPVQKINLNNPVNQWFRGHIRSMGYTDFDMKRPFICEPKWLYCMK